MNQPYLAPHSFHPYALSSHSSPTSPYQYTGPAHTLPQQLQEISLQSHPSTHQNQINNGIPSEEQRAAVLTLRAFPNPTILAYLKNLRSFLRDETPIHPNRLSDQQRQAFLALTGYSDELVLTLLNCARFSGSRASSQDFHDSSPLYNGRVAANFSTPLPSFTRNASTHNTLDSAFVQGSHSLSRDNFIGRPSSSAASSTEHKRWCFVSENHTQDFTTVDGFKKHLREHFTQYSCIPQRDIVYKEDGPKCAFCNFPNPDRIHLVTHATGCVGSNFTRKNTLITHLKNKHGLHGGSVLAEQFEYTVDQKYFACGFCVCWFGSLNDLANHVDDRHYKLSQHIRDWDNNNVIRGLLSQPLVAECWQAVLASNPPLQASWFQWTPTLLKELISRLEMSREPAETLCYAAIHASNYRWNSYGYLEPVPADQGMVANQTIEPFERQDAISPLSFNSEQSHIAYSPNTTAAFPQLQHPTSDWDEGRRWPQIASETYESPASPTHQHPSRAAQISHPANCGESFMQYQYPSSTASASGTPQAFEGQALPPYSSRLGGHSPGMSPNLATNLRSRHQMETYTTPAEARDGWVHPASTTESVSSDMSLDRNISPPGHFNDTYSSRSYPPVAAHPSNREPTHRRGTDMDPYSSDQQRFPHARGRSRR